MWSGENIQSKRKIETSSFYCTDSAFESTISDNRLLVGPNTMRAWRKSVEPGMRAWCLSAVR